MTLILYFEFVAPAPVAALAAASMRRQEFDSSENIELIREPELFQPRGVIETDDFEIIGSVVELAIPYFSKRRPGPIRPNNDIVGVVWRRLGGDLAHDPVFLKLVGAISDAAIGEGLTARSPSATRGTPCGLTVLAGEPATKAAMEGMPRPDVTLRE